MKFICVGVRLKCQNVNESKHGLVEINFEYG